MTGEPVYLTAARLEIGVAFGVSPSALPSELERVAVEHSTRPGFRAAVDFARAAAFDEFAADVRDAQAVGRRRVHIWLAVGFVLAAGYVGVRIAEPHWLTWRLDVFLGWWWPIIPIVAWGREQDVYRRISRKIEKIGAS